MPEILSSFAWIAGFPPSGCLLSSSWKEGPSDASLQNLHLIILLGVFIVLPIQRCQLSMTVQAAKEIKRRTLCGFSPMHLHICDRTIHTHCVIDLNRTKV